jgi:ubiquinone/menaquinone biosynthesis C-methylase UbiE
LSFFNEAYHGVPPWDIGHPQKEFVRLEGAGLVNGDVIDIGCGTGEHAIFFASKGHDALGVDSAPLAIEKAKTKAKSRGSKAEFIVADALDLGVLGRKFDTAIDCGVFHVFPDRERALYVKSLAKVLSPGGKYFMLVFSDKEPADWGGPRRISKSEIEEAFAKGWKVDFIQPASFESKYHEDGGRAWLAGTTLL